MIRSGNNGWQIEWGHRPLRFLGYSRYSNSVDSCFNRNAASRIAPNTSKRCGMPPVSPRERFPQNLGDVATVNDRQNTDIELAQPVEHDVCRLVGVQVWQLI